MSVFIANLIALMILFALAILMATAIVKYGFWGVLFFIVALAALETLVHKKEKGDE